jgi:predicted enzyme related to lactoylglutathione lyase
MNPVIRLEVPYRDGAHATAFCRDAFGWKTAEPGGRMGHYILVVTGESDIVPEAPGRAINGGLYPAKDGSPRQTPTIVIGVEEMTASRAKLVASGGTFLGDPSRVPNAGDDAAVIDPEGHRVALLQPKTLV